jgi:hypothetical protein
LFAGRSRSYDQNAESEDLADAALDAVTTEPPVRNDHDEMPPADRVALAIALAKSYADLGALESSLGYYRMALSGRASPALSATLRAEVTKNITKLRAAIRRDANNAQRVPVIHKELDQGHLVRPRLVAVQKALPPARPDRSAKSGGAQ